jgi:hypothetical protein
MTREGQLIPFETSYITINDLEILESERTKTRGLCKYLLNYTFLMLKHLEKKFVKLWNVSEDANGVPACRCYIRAALNNDYVVVRREKLFNNNGKIIKGSYNFSVIENIDELDQVCIARLTQNIYYFFSKDIFPTFIKEDLKKVN